MAEQAQSQQVDVQAAKVDLINEDTYKRYINIKTQNIDGMSFSDWAAREQVKLLRAIDGKLTFFALLIILGMILSFFQALAR